MSHDPTNPEARMPDNDEPSGIFAFNEELKKTLHRVQSAIPAEFIVIDSVVGSIQNLAVELEQTRTHCDELTLERNHYRESCAAWDRMYAACSTERDRYKMAHEEYAKHTERAQKTLCVGKHLGKNVLHGALDEIDALRKQVETLTRERDEAKSDVAKVTRELAYEVGSHRITIEKRKEFEGHADRLCQERDAAIAAKEKAERERDALRSQLHDGHRWTKIRDERDALQARVRDLEKVEHACTSAGWTAGSIEDFLGYWESRAKELDARLAAMTALLEEAAEVVCSAKCPSTWRTADGKPPCCDLHQRIDAALKAAAEGEKP